jgi:hypothetical protein
MHRLVVLFQQWRYLFLLGALSALLVIQPIAAEFGVMEPLFDVLLVLVVAILTLALAREKLWRVVASILLAATAILSLGGHFLSPTAETVSLSCGHLIGALFFIAVTLKIVGSIFATRDLSLDSVFGAICGYLLLGVAWGLTYATIDAASPKSFQFDDALRPFVERSGAGNHIFLYYSFVTLTTVGYGDVSPVSMPARTLSWVEALIGQLYLAILIAGLISALVTKRVSGAYEWRGDPIIPTQQRNEG